jgi:ArsR family transcriptional regulator
MVAIDSNLHALARQQAEICSVFGSTRRVLIVWALGQQEMSVSELAAAIGTTLQNTSQHLRLMKAKGVVQSRREGHTVYYRVAENEEMAACPVLRNSPLIKTEGE